MAQSFSLSFKGPPAHSRMSLQMCSLSRSLHFTFLPLPPHDRSEQAPAIPCVESNITYRGLVGGASPPQIQVHVHFNLTSNFFLLSSNQVISWPLLTIFRSKEKEGNWKGSNGWQRSRRFLGAIWKKIEMETARLSIPKETEGGLMNICSWEAFPNKVGNPFSLTWSQQGDITEATFNRWKHSTCLKDILQHKQPLFLMCLVNVLYAEVLCNYTAYFLLGA